jgi:hypothetical protein
VDGIRNEKTPQQPTVRRRIAEAFPLRKASRSGEYTMPRAQHIIKKGYALKAGQLTYDCRHSTMHGMLVTGGRGFRGLKPL